MRLIQRVRNSATLGHHGIYASAGISQRFLQYNPERNRRGCTLCLECCIGNFAAGRQPEQGRRIVGYTHRRGQLFI